MLELFTILPSERTTRDIAELRELTNEISFFKQLTLKHGPRLNTACCRTMTIVQYKAGETVCKYGESGDCSFVILEGVATVLVPFRSVGFRPIKQLSLDFDQDLLNDNQTPTPDLKAAKLNSWGNFLTKIETPVGFKSTISDFREVNSLEVGDSFGELSLLTNKMRAATILAKTDLTLTKLTKEDFSRVLQRIELESLEIKIGFLRSIAVFKNWTRESLQKLTYFLKPCKFKQGAVVFREDSPSNEVFIVKKGEFKFYKQLRQDGLATPMRLNHRRRSSTSLKLHAEIKGTREIFGVDDVIEGRPRLMTCECSSPTGALYMIEKRDFIDLIQRSDSWDYLVTAHEQSEAWREQKLERLSRAELFIKTFETVQPFRPKSSAKMTLSERRRSASNEKIESLSPVTKRQPKAKDLNLQFDNLSSSPVRKLEVKDRSLTSRTLSFNTAKAGDPSLLKSLKTMNDRKPSFEWHNSPLPRSKASEFRASRAPPSFFARGKLAILTRYQHSPKISGMKDSPSKLRQQHDFTKKKITLKAKLAEASSART